MSILDLFITKAHAAVSGLPSAEITPKGSIDTSTSVNLQTIWDNALDILFFLAGAAAVIFLIWSGISYITSGGDAEKAKKAKAGIINAVIGIIVIVAAYAIINFAAGIGDTIQQAV